MKTYSAGALAALESGSALVAGAVKIAATPDPLRVWSGWGDISLTDAAAETYTGVGDRGLVAASGGHLGGAEQAVVAELSGVDPTNLALLDATTVRGVPALVWRLIFDSAGATLLDSRVFTRGRVDRLEIEETPGGSAVIRIHIEGAARGLGRSGGRMRTDADQRLILATDGGCKRVAFAGEKILYLGGKPPQRAGDGLPNTSSAGGSGGVGRPGIRSVISGRS